MKPQTVLIAVLVSLAGCAHTESNAAPTASTPAFDVARHLQNRPACFLVTNASGKAVVRSDAERCARRFRPYSTFKIPNSLIGLETGVLADADTVIEWDPTKYPAADWWPSAWKGRNDLRSAFAHSVVPYYRALATRVGAAAMNEHLEKFRYGSRAMDGELDSFWLNGGLGISADEQVAFLRDFYHERLGVAPRSTKIVKSIMVLEQTADYTFSGKTGTGDEPDGSALGWLVGYVESGPEVSFYALNVSAASIDDLPRQWRIDTVRAMLGELGLLGAASAP